MGQMAGLMSPYIQTFGRQLNQQAFNDQLGRASNQMYQPSSQIGTYDPYTAARRSNYMPYGPNQQFYQPIYQPMYGPFGGVFQPPMQQFQPMMPQRTVLTPQPMQTQYRPIPYMSQTQLDARQNMFGNPGLSVGATTYDGSGGGWGDGGFGGFGGGASSDGGGYSGPGSVGPEGATASGGMGPGDGAGDSGVGVGMGGDSTGEGVFKGGGRVRKQNYGGIDALLRK